MKRISHLGFFSFSNIISENIFVVFENVLGHSRLCQKARVPFCSSPEYRGSYFFSVISNISSKSPPSLGLKRSVMAKAMSLTFFTAAYVRFNFYGKVFLASFMEVQKPGVR